MKYFKWFDTEFNNLSADWVYDYNEHSWIVSDIEKNGYCVSCIWKNCIMLEVY